MKAVIYTRVSSENDRQDTERQKKSLSRYANAMGYSILTIFDEHCSGGKETKDRPVLQSMMQYCKAHSVDIVLFSELSRLGRNAFETLELVKWFKDNKINLFLEKENFMLLDEKGEPSLFAPIFIACCTTFAQMEREAIFFRLQQGRQLAKEKGVKFGRKVGSVKSLETKQSEYKEVIRELKRGTSIRRTAKLCGVSASTVQMVKRDFGL